MAGRLPWDRLGDGTGTGEAHCFSEDNAGLHKLRFYSRWTLRPAAIAAAPS
jgi:hypothetical protein